MPPSPSQLTDPRRLCCSEHLVVLNLAGSQVPPDRVVGLVRLTDLLTFMPQIMYMCSSESAKRLRPS